VGVGLSRLVRAPKGEGECGKVRWPPGSVNGPRRRAKLRHEADALSVPVSIDGKTDDFLFDTGAWQSAMTELKARKLGLAIHEGTKVFVGSSGQAATFRTAVAKEMVLGAMRFRDVSFAVIAAEGPFRDADVGVIGMPILLAIGHITWSKDGTVEIGGTSAPSPSTTPNLVFDRHRLLLRADVLGRQVLTTFDTRANTTDLNANFATLFPDVVARGKKGTQDITGVGGTQSFDSVELPELLVNIGPESATLRPANVTLQRIALIGGEC
jgi:Aspartyl protease